MVQSARAAHAPISLAVVVHAFLTTSRTYLGLPNPTRPRQRALTSSEFVDPLQYRVSGLRPQDVCGPRTQDFLATVAPSSTPALPKPPRVHSRCTSQPTKRHPLPR